MDNCINCNSGYNLEELSGTIERLISKAETLSTVGMFCESALAFKSEKDIFTYFGILEEMIREVRLFYGLFQKEVARTLALVAE